MRLLTKWAAVLLTALILCPVTAPFSPCSLSELITGGHDSASTDSSATVTRADGPSAPLAGAGSVLIEEQLKDEAVLTRTSVPETGETEVDYLPLVFRWVGTARSAPLVLRV